MRCGSGSPIPESQSERRRVGGNQPSGRGSLLRRLAAAAGRDATRKSLEPRGRDRDAGVDRCGGGCRLSVVVQKKFRDPKNKNHSLTVTTHEVACIRPISRTNAPCREAFQPGPKHTTRVTRSIRHHTMTMVVGLSIFFDL
jgi:hypothetical protein